MKQLFPALNRPATLDEIPDASLERLARVGFDWVWLLSVWQTGAEGQKVSRSNPQWRKEFEETRFCSEPHRTGSSLDLNYGNPDTQAAMIGKLVKIAAQGDGVRCDMAMLVLPESVT
jgi:hypothetical protein